MTVDVVNIKGDKTGRSVDLPDEIFGIAPNDHAIYLSVKQYLGNQRQGTHKTKEKGEINFSTRKIKRQKGTGTARAGSLKSPLFRKGGRVFGPKPHLYHIKLNKKVKGLARKSAYSTRAAGGQITVIEDFTFEKPQTREFANILDNLKLTDSKSLFLTSDYDQNLQLSCRNLKSTNVMHARDANTYSILHAKTLVLSENAVQVIKESFAS